MTGHSVLDSHLVVDRLLKKFQETVASEFADDFLIVLLDLLALVLLVNAKFRENIRDFNATYFFQTRDGSLQVTALFRHDRLEVQRNAPAGKPDITITFQDGKALMGFLLARNPDILGSMLRQEVSLEGNLNYLYKLAYMARHLQLMTAKGLCS